MASICRSPVVSPSKSRAVRTGIAYKKGGKLTPIFQRRFIILHSSKVLEYFKVDKEDEAVMSSRKCIKLEGLSRNSVVEFNRNENNHGFKIMTSKRTFYFSVSTQQARDQWIASLRNVIDGVITRHSVCGPLAQSETTVTISRRNDTVQITKHSLEEPVRIIRRSPSNSMKQDVNWSVERSDWSDSVYSFEGAVPNDERSLDSSECVDAPPIAFRKQYSLPFAPPILTVDFESELMPDTPPLPPVNSKKSERSIEPIARVPMANSTRKKRKRIKRKRKSNDLKICLNGERITDIVEHVIDRMIAEDEWYEDDQDELEDEEYDPNHLSVWEYDDD